MTVVDRQLADTRQAFDQVAPDYDGPMGNNEVVQLMRQELWREVASRLTPPAGLLDLGCGIGLDAAHFARRGYSVLAIDWSPGMVDRARDRYHNDNVEHRARALVLGIHELQQLSDDRFEGIYSNLGALNCVPDLRTASRECARLLRPGGQLVFSVIGRSCPWETAYYSVRGDPARAHRRAATDAVPVSLSGQRVWTRYYTPIEFYDQFSTEFVLVGYRSLALTVPAPYLVGLYRRLGRVGPILNCIDRVIGRLPGVRDYGDHFLMSLSKREVSGVDR
jgi:ubiquinone/menaquinone biosynthesis C-methylase UbiE